MIQLYEDTPFLIISYYFKPSSSYNSTAYWGGGRPLIFPACHLHWLAITQDFFLFFLKCCPYWNLQSCLSRRVMALRVTDSFSKLKTFSSKFLEAVVFGVPSEICTEYKVYRALSLQFRDRFYTCKPLEFLDFSSFTTARLLKVRVTIS